MLNKDILGLMQDGDGLTLMSAYEKMVTDFPGRVYRSLVFNKCGTQTERIPHVKNDTAYTSVTEVIHSL